MKAKFWLILFFCISVTFSAIAQRVAIKSNLLYDASLSPNFGIELRIAPHWSLDIAGNYNPWNLNNDTKWKHWMLQPEMRYWLCESMNNHFFALHTHCGAFNFGHIKNNINFLGTHFSRLSNLRFQGYFVGLGIGYGYAWILNRHWNLEAEIGFGYSYVMYDTFECAGCGKKIEEDQDHHYVGATKAAINIVYVF